MPPAPATIAALVAGIEGLEFSVEDVDVEMSDVPVPDYPGGSRPSAVVSLSGSGVRGRGEHVLWTVADHRAFGRHAAEQAPRGTWRFGAWSTEVARRTPSPHGRAALECAGLDLALRQAGRSLFALAGVPPQPVRYVVSFERRPDPAAEIERRRQRTPGLEFKIDADPRWTDATYRDLAALGGVAVVDFKGGGGAADHERAHVGLPGAWLEDPAPEPTRWSAAVRSRVSFDAAIGRAADVDRMPVVPAAVNVKPARVGGVLEALHCIEACARRGIPIYFGGMFEVSIGRSQLHVLAALLAPTSPNDVAPLSRDGERACASGHLVIPDEPGFGGAAAETGEIR
jgi:L-alanine-DL-glutamate epimerase-like enolase superfamily enzyme